MATKIITRLRDNKQEFEEGVLLPVKAFNYKGKEIEYILWSGKAGYFYDKE